MPTFKRKSGSSHTDVGHVKRRSGSGWVDVSFVRRREGGAWVDVWPAGPSVTLNNHSVSGDTTSFISTLTLTFRSNGALSATTTSGLSVVPTFDSDEWLTSGSAADCQLYVTLGNGSLDVGTTNTWLDLTSDRAYGISTNGVNDSALADLTCQIRNKNTLSVLDTCLITLSISGL